MRKVRCRNAAYRSESALRNDVSSVWLGLGTSPYDPMLEDDTEYSINNEEDLKNKLLEYERYQSITNTFKELEEKRGEFFTKLHPQSFFFL